MDPILPDALPAGVVHLDRRGRIRDVNRWFTEWLEIPGDHILGTPFDRLLQTIDDDLVPADFHLGTLMMRRPDPSDRAALVTRTESSDGAILIVVDATERYRALRALRKSYRLAARTETRLQLVIDASLAFSEATSDEQLASILAETTAQAFSAEDSAVLLVTDRGSLRLAAGRNPLEAAPDMARAASFILGMRDVLTVSGYGEADALSPTLGSSMREEGVESILVAPLEYEQRSYGVVACFFRHPRQFDVEAVPLAEALAGQATQALVAIYRKGRLEHAATHDDVTGLPNRRLLEEQLKLRTPGDDRRRAVIFLDLDGFKAINDEHGHPMGDEVLREVGRRLLATVREGDIVARYGGDEFVVASRVADPSSATDLAERLRATVGAPMEFLGPDISLGVSVGVVIESADEGSRTADRLIRAADIAMYTAKGEGGNRVVESEPFPRDNGAWRSSFPRSSTASASR
jgi:diguanylate cyclase (GGDEF)-like protein